MKRQQKKQWYICDPSKNKECKKRNCYRAEHAAGVLATTIRCCKTSHAEYAKLGLDGKPLKAAD